MLGIGGIAWHYAKRRKLTELCFPSRFGGAHERSRLSRGLRLTEPYSLGVLLGRSSLTSTISKAWTATRERLDFIKPEGMSGSGLQVKVLYKKTVYITDAGRTAASSAPCPTPGLFLAPPSPQHLPLQGVVSVETPESWFSLPTRCYPDNCDLALGGPRKDVSGCLF